ncbi:transposase [Deinococcus sp.]|uniref:transposase n=1 Tax=Deinococcus sp. TaxID=47478 RepID=UPI003C7B77EA
MPERNHSREFKLQVVGQINAGLHTTVKLCREHSLAPSLIHRWRKEVEDRGEAAFTDGAKTGSDLPVAPAMWVHSSWSCAAAPVNR